MAFYIVRAQPHWKKLDDLRARLDAGEVERMRPFGRALDESLRGARLESDDVAIWEEEDYCRPPLAQERAAVLDDYFDDIRVEAVGQGEGWARIEGLPTMWRDAHPGEEG
jgi:hypothetical protein